MAGASRDLGLPGDLPWAWVLEYLRRSLGEPSGSRGPVFRERGPDGTAAAEAVTVSGAFPALATARATAIVDPLR
ncbi:hypothetical protein [Streptosporangium vulgare]|uniref:hypothetical protein n=1 Tax=Streptosporangium vulgare TaxID=46190 RepID=UPI0031DF08F4